jgi:peptide deformylase
MAERPILTLPDTRLRTPCAPVTLFDSALSDSVQDLIDTLRGSTGIGLAAPQIGDLRQILVMDLSETRNDPQVFINPEILTRDVKARVEESCLSIPGVEGNVIRDIRITVQAQDVHGHPFERVLEDMYAVCLQHEWDHLRGILFIDRLPAMERWKLRLTRGIRTSPLPHGA